MKPTESYIICATPRSGSTLLCDLLSDTGVAGRPNSFFRRQSFRSWVDEFGVSNANWATEQDFDQAYLAAVKRLGSAGTGVFGMRLMWESLGDLSKRLGVFYPDIQSDSARFEAAFGPSLYVHLSREDKVAQAISRLKAEQSGLWHVAADGTERERIKPGETPVYDGRAILEIVAELETHDAAWANWFARHKIRPVRITYEALSIEPTTAAATILSALGLAPGIAATIEPRTARLANRTSEDWASRFRSEQGET